MEIYTMPISNRGAALGPLTLPVRRHEVAAPLFSTATKQPDYAAPPHVPNPESVIQCLFCQQLYYEPDPYLLQHLINQHKFVISDVKTIADLKSYLEYWRRRFQETPLTQICTIVKTNPSPVEQAPSEYFYLLCDALPEDKHLRELLQKKRLEEILEQQQRERNDPNFRRTCLFCKREFEGNRASLFNHMIYDHNFSIGQPDNIVFGDELLQLLEDKLKNLQCLYCEKTFKSWSALKEHMRKKQHKRIRPTNTLYDRFYVINYLELGKNWETIQSESDAYLTPVGNENTEEEWNDWVEEEAIPTAQCLFCDLRVEEFAALNRHMKERHQFDLEETRTSLHINFYSQVKLVNYIRYRVAELRCIGCDARFEGQVELVNHMATSGHINQHRREMWDQPQYFFPKLPDDYLLTMLDDEDLPGDADIVMPEDMPAPADEATQQSLQMLRLEDSSS